MSTDNTEIVAEVDVNADGFESLQEVSLNLFERQLTELSYEDAAFLVGGLIRGLTQSEGMRVISTVNGRVVVDSKLDGKESMENFGMQQARELTPGIDDEGELIINVVRNKTVWDVIRNRKPKVIKTLRYKNEPMEHA
ncbi:MAG: hypothetical protein ACOH18_01730 [Candidatus Saccharimonadaceae bacterium]